MASQNGIPLWGIFEVVHHFLAFVWWPAFPPFCCQSILHEQGAEAASDLLTDYGPSVVFESQEPSFQGKRLKLQEVGNILAHWQREVLAFPAENPLREEGSHKTIELSQKEQRGGPTV